MLAMQLDPRSGLVLLTCKFAPGLVSVVQPLTSSQISPFLLGYDVVERHKERMNAYPQSIVEGIHSK